MKTSELIDRLMAIRMTASVLVSHAGFKYACSSFSRGNNKLLILKSSAPQTVEETIDDLRLFSQGGDIDVVWVGSFAYLDKDKILVPIIDVEYDGKHAIIKVMELTGDGK